MEEVLRKGLWEDRRCGVTREETRGVGKTKERRVVTGGHTIQRESVIRRGPGLSSSVVVTRVPDGCPRGINLWLTYPLTYRPPRVIIILVTRCLHRYFGPTGVRVRPVPVPTSVLLLPVPSSFHDPGPDAPVPLVVFCRPSRPHTPTLRRETSKRSFCLKPSSTRSLIV